MHSDLDLESLDPLFLDMYFSKPNFAKYGYTSTYHTNALSLVLHLCKQLLDMIPCVSGRHACAYLNFSKYSTNTGEYIG